MDGGSAGFAGATNRSTAMDGGSAGFAGATNRSTAMDDGVPVLQEQQTARLLFLERLLV